MKKLTVGIFLFAGSVFSSCTVTEVVRARPEAPVGVAARPVPPGPHFVWIEDYWVWNPRIRAYTWHAGYWAAPRPGFLWVRGHWAARPEGWRWVPGHWRPV
ncbi:MAG TPA: YXWGXW repeat-containing protein [Chitinophagaceae bacterium]|nr:YXWGXW repeat-containing protein [Chitinophagaceae bacterium]